MEIRAAGGVVIEGDRVVLVHRARHDDWSLPKGKLDPGEDGPEAALREVEEECALRCALEDELPSTHYEVGGTPKTVQWWRMRVVEDLGFAPNEEVDEVRWATRSEADDLLSYDLDRVTLSAAWRGP